MERDDESVKKSLASKKSLPSSFNIFIKRRNKISIEERDILFLSVHDPLVHGCYIHGAFVQQNVRYPRILIEDRASAAPQR